METTRPFNPLSDLFARALLGDEKNTSLLTNFINAFLTRKQLSPVISVEILNPYVYGAVEDGLSRHGQPDF